SETTDKKSPQQRLQGDQEVAPERSRSRSKRVKKSLVHVGSRAKTKASATQREKENGRKKERGRKRVLADARAHAAAPGFASGDCKPEKQSDASLKSDPRALAREDDFARFMAVYPRKVNEHDARATWAKVVVAAGADADAVVNGAAIYAAVRAAEIARGDD